MRDIKCNDEGCLLEPKANSDESDNMGDENVQTGGGLAPEDEEYLVPLRGRTKSFTKRKKRIRQVDSGIKKLRRKPTSKKKAPKKKGKKQRKVTKKAKRKKKR